MVAKENPGDDGHGYGDSIDDSITYARIICPAGG